MEEELYAGVVLAFPIMYFHGHVQAHDHEMNMRHKIVLMGPHLLFKN